MEYDLIIRGGQILDGTGKAAFLGDIAVSGERIVAVGNIDGPAKQCIDAQGCVVTPGFVDIHTHLDAQVGWDDMLSSCCWHGVTSVVMGNCGVSFAPIRAEHKEFLATMMESVEDIPAEGILSSLSWNWETYGQYLADLDQRRFGLNVGGMVGHCAVRVYAMGERSLQKEPASDEDIAAMCEIVDEAIEAGALGFSTSRSFLHKIPDGQPVPGTFADDRELFAIADVLGKRKKGVFQSAPGLPISGKDISPAVRELNVLGEISRRSQRPVSFSLVASSKRPGFYRDVLAVVQKEVDEGANLRPQSTTRPIGLLYGLNIKLPWADEAAWEPLKKMSNEAKLDYLRDPENRANLLDSELHIDPNNLYLLTPGVMDYRPLAENSLAAESVRRECCPLETFIELSIESEGMIAFTYPILNDEWESVEYMMSDPNIVLGLADAGAHVSMVMDASQPTWTLAHLARDIGFLPLEEAVRRMTSDTADLFGITERGRLQVGMYADINVIDMDSLAMLPPEMVNDLPQGEARIIQKAEGYRHTIVNGKEFMRDGEHTGQLAGKILRSQATV